MKKKKKESQKSLGGRWEAQPFYLPDWKSALGKLRSKSLMATKAMKRGLRLRTLWHKRVPEEWGLGPGSQQTHQSPREHGKHWPCSHPLISWRPLSVLLTSSLWMGPSEFWNSFPPPAAPQWVLAPFCLHYSSFSLSSSLLTQSYRDSSSSLRSSRPSTSAR